MKLKFNKTTDGNISAIILSDKDQVQFSYIKMIEALLDGETITCEFSDNITKEEQMQIKNLNDAIYQKVYPDKLEDENSLF
ncbi:MAG: hypothetical protein IKW11_05275 [Bacteroidales bacterium]|nr:hypothetical protein [Bacteroidales bacterium]